MSKSTKCLALVLMGSMLLVGCGGAGMGMPQLPIMGIAFSDVQGTSMISSAAAGDKTGEGEVMSILGLVAMGDVSVGTIMEKEGMTKVQRVDYKFFNILGIYATLKVKVTGE